MAARKDCEHTYSAADCTGWAVGCTGWAVLEERNRAAPEGKVQTGRSQVDHKAAARTVALASRMAERNAEVLFE